MNGSDTLKRNKVIIPGYIRNHPNHFEVKISLLLCAYFKSDLEFIDVADAHTPDILVKNKNQLWEIKELNGSGKNTVHHAISRAHRQSENIILAIRNTKLYQNQIIGRIKRELRVRRDIKRLILVTKELEIIVIKGKV